METVISFSGEVKALANGKVGGYLVRFSSEDAPDLVGDFFTKDTDFVLEGKTRSDLYYAHGTDPSIGKQLLNYKAAKLRVDDIGVWAEAQLDLRDEYESVIYNLAQAGKMGWSSGTAAHLVEREPKKNAIWLKRWPLGMDASLTPVPCEPRNEAVPLKSLTIEPILELKSQGLSAENKISLIERALPKGGGYKYICDLFDAEVVFCQYGEDGCSQYFEAPYTIDGGVATVGEPKAVARRTCYDEISATKGLAFDEHTDQLLTSLTEWGTRLKALAALRSRDNRELADARRCDIKAVTRIVREIEDSVSQMCDKRSTGSVVALAEATLLLSNHGGNS